MDRGMRKAYTKTADPTKKANKESAKTECLRDYFAGCAMNGIIAAGEAHTKGEMTFDAYSYADAMLIRRKAKP